MSQLRAGKFETGESSPSISHVRFIDGMRAVAAMYVVMHHAYIHFLVSYIPVQLAFLEWGHVAVTVFIVISGYCLALPVLRSGYTLKGGAVHFYKKRVRRILPPYYAILFIAIVREFFLHPSGQRLAFFELPLIQKSILLHALMIHNLFGDVAYTLEGPLWSVATEMQIYLLFPIVVLIWKRFGTGWMLASTFFVAHLTYYLLVHVGNTNYLFEFALGLCAAEMTIRKPRRVYLFTILATSLIALYFVSNNTSYLSDIFVGLGTASFITLCTTTHFWPRSVLSVPLLTWIGGFAYSIYLVHETVRLVYLVSPLAKPGRLHGWLLFSTQSFVYVSLVLLVSYLFHRAVERPFMTIHNPRPTLKPQEAQGALS